MGKIIDIAGMRFSRWFVVARDVEAVGHGSSMWKCVCDCGNSKTVSGYNLRNGRTLSCGCYHREVVTDAGTTHGQSKLPYCSNWQSMISRCYNAKCNGYSKYGAKGIFVCDFLRENPVNLFNLIGDRPSIKHSIDRFPNCRGSYTCGGCRSCVNRGDTFNIRWATQYQQTRNMSKNVILTHQGVSMCVVDWAKKLGIPQTTIYHRVDRGVDPFVSHRL